RGEFGAVDELLELADGVAHEAKRPVEPVGMLLLEAVADVLDQRLAFDAAADLLELFAEALDLLLAPAQEGRGGIGQAPLREEPPQLLLADRPVEAALGQDVDDEPVLVLLQRVLHPFDEAVQL